MEPPSILVTRPSVDGPSIRRSVSDAQSRNSRPMIIVTESSFKARSLNGDAVNSHLGLEATQKKASFDMETGEHSPGLMSLSPASGALGSDISSRTSRRRRSASFYVDTEDVNEKFREIFPDYKDLGEYSKVTLLRGHATADIFISPANSDIGYQGQTMDVGSILSGKSGSSIKSGKSVAASSIFGEKARSLLDLITEDIPVPEEIIPYSPSPVPSIPDHFGDIPMTEQDKSPGPHFANQNNFTMADGSIASLPRDPGFVSPTFRVVPKWLSGYIHPTTLATALLSITGFVSTVNLIINAVFSA